MLLGCRSLFETTVTWGLLPFCLLLHTARSTSLRYPSWASRHQAITNRMPTGIPSSSRHLFASQTSTLFRHPLTSSRSLSHITKSYDNDRDRTVSIQSHPRCQAITTLSTPRHWRKTSITSVRCSQPRVLRLSIHSRITQVTSVRRLNRNSHSSANRATSLNTRNHRSIPPISQQCCLQLG